MCHRSFSGPLTYDELLRPSIWLIHFSVADGFPEVDPSSQGSKPRCAVTHHYHGQQNRSCDFGVLLPHRNTSCLRIGKSGFLSPTGLKLGVPRTTIWSTCFYLPCYRTKGPYFLLPIATHKLDANYSLFLVCIPFSSDYNFDYLVSCHCLSVYQVVFDDACI